MIKEKEKSWQILKGCCVIAVLCIHCRTGTEFDDRSWNFWYWFLLRQVVDFAVPIFFFAAGYFVNEKKILDNFSAYLEVRLKKLIVPLYLWATVYTGINLLLDILMNSETDMSIVAFNWITGRVGTPFYFVLVLIQFTILLPILMRLSKTKLGSFIVVTVVGIWYFILYLFMAKHQDLFSGYETICLTWLSVYYAGILCKKKAWKGYGNCLQRWILVIVMLLVSIMEGLLLYKLGISVGIAVSQTRISSVGWSFALINLFLFYRGKINLSSSKWLRLLNYIGDNSFGIFFVHCLFRKAGNYVIPYVPFANECLPLYQMIQFTIMLIGSIITIWCIKKVFKTKASEIWGV